MADPDSRDIVARLRAAYENGWGVGMSEALVLEAADEIARLRARLRIPCKGCPGCPNDCPDAHDFCVMFALLSQKKEG